MQPKLDLHVRENQENKQAWIEKMVFVKVPISNHIKPEKGSWRLSERH